jgi:hypothetical protein
VPDVKLFGYSPDGSRTMMLTWAPVVPEDTDGMLDLYEFSGGATHLVFPGQDYTVKAWTANLERVVVYGAQLIAGEANANVFDVVVSDADLSAPVAQITAPVGIKGPSPSAEFGTASGDGTWFECRVDAGAWDPCTSPTTLGPLSDGTHVFDVRAFDPAGNGDSASASFVADAISPVAVAPANRLVTGSALASGLVPVRLTWSGSDAGSGVGPYAVSRSTDGHPYVSVSTALTGTSLTRNLSTGHTYGFAIRATDKVGNTGAWAYGSVFRVTAISQASSAVHYHGTWATSTSTTWWGGTARWSSMKGSTVSYTFTGKSIALVGLKAANRGKANVYVNGVLNATVDLYSATTLRQRIVWSANYATSATRTVTIKVLGTSGRPRVDIDGFVVVR